MASQPVDKVPKVECADFPGLFTHVDPADADDGTGADQVNLTSARPGELRSRPGYRKVTFAEE